MTVLNEKLEQISALLDGELESAQSTIDYLLQDEQARDVWQSMQLTKDIAHNSIERQASAGFSAGIMSALEDEPSILVPEARRSVVAAKKSSATVLPFLRPVAGLAVAATVAAVTIFSFDNLGAGQPQLSGSALATVVPSLAPAVVPVAFTGTYDSSDRTYWKGSDEGMQDELNRYLVDHTEHSNPGGYQSMVPYVRVAGYDNKK